MSLERYEAKRAIFHWGVYDNVAKQWAKQNCSSKKEAEALAKRMNR